MNIVILTADENNGGIKQFTFQVLKTFLSIGYDVTLFIPDIKTIDVPSEHSKNVIRYKKQKDILGITPAIIKTSKEINKFKPDCVFLTDDSMYSIQIVRLLKRNTRVIMTMHDVTSHPTAKISLKRKVLRFISTKLYRKIAFRRVERIVVLSNNSKRRLKELYPSIEPKIVTAKLGAHPPIIRKDYSPSELDQSCKYVLFFGRIQKYKGIIRAIRAFNSVDSNKSINLVIAGSGTFSKEENEELQKNKKIIVINRFINDSEMIWLFKNALFVILPYIEASQSGVIPLSYHYGIPVIASNIDGLSEFVENDTGILFDNEEELKDIFKRIFSGFLTPSNYSEKCKAYEQSTLNWEKNFKDIIESKF